MSELRQGIEDGTIKLSFIHSFIHSFIYLLSVRKIIWRKLQVYFLINTDLK